MTNCSLFCVSGILTSKLAPINSKFGTFPPNPTKIDKLFLPLDVIQGNGAGFNYLNEISNGRAACEQWLRIRFFPGIGLTRWRKLSLLRKNALLAELLSSSGSRFPPGAPLTLNQRSIIILIRVVPSRGKLLMKIDCAGKTCLKGTITENTKMKYFPVTVNIF